MRQECDETFSRTDVAESEANLSRIEGLDRDLRSSDGTGEDDTNDQRDDEDEQRSGDI